MPFYEYRCTDCLHRWSENRRVGDRDVPTVCPSCGHRGERVRFAGVMFAEVKGTGNGRIGGGLERRAEEGRKRAAEWK